MCFASLFSSLGFDTSVVGEDSLGNYNNRVSLHKRAQLCAGVSVCLGKESQWKLTTFRISLYSLYAIINSHQIRFKNFLVSLVQAAKCRIQSYPTISFVWSEGRGFMKQYITQPFPFYLPSSFHFRYTRTFPTNYFQWISYFSSLSFSSNSWGISVALASRTSST